jgi:nitrite reductase/ring-hydroxylating ferredoxin subunit
VTTGKIAGGDGLAVKTYSTRVDGDKILVRLD